MMYNGMGLELVGPVDEKYGGFSIIHGMLKVMKSFHGGKRASTTFGNQAAPWHKAMMSDTLRA